MLAAKRHNPLGAFLLLALLATTALLLLTASARAQIQIEKFDFETTDSGGAATQQAGAHPEELVTRFLIGKDANEVPLESPRNLVVDLPLGSTGSPSATALCTEAQLEAVPVAQCPIESQVGTVRLFPPAALPFAVYAPIYNMVTPPGRLAQFGFTLAGNAVHMTATVHSEPDYGVSIRLSDLPQPIPYTEAMTTFWGVPAASSHDGSRGECLGLTGPTGAECASHPTAILPFLTNPSACSATSIATGHVNSWSDPLFTTVEAGNENDSGEPIGIEGCDAVQFKPTISVRPTTNLGDSPTGLDVNIHLPQNSDPNGVATAQLRDTDIVFPPGLTINSASGAGLEGCSPAQIGLTSAVGQADAHFDEAVPACSDGSKLGTVRVVTPLLNNPLQGTLYLASPDKNPFGSLLGLYIAVQDPDTGVVIKLAGHPIPDPQTGQLTVRFDRNPQLPFEDLEVKLFPGSRAALKTPLGCGQFTTTSTMVPWTAPVGASASPSDDFGIVGGAGGSPCPGTEAQAPHQPTLSAGTEDPAAGEFSPFVMRISRADGSQPLKGIDVALPKGLLGRLAGVPYCSDSSLAQAATKTGKAEQAAASCPAASRVGSVNVGAGAGSTPLYVSGDVYLAGPYKGAPLSLAVITPAVAGPFDLGDVVVRVALQIDPETAQIHAVSDPLPTILQGIPLDLRSIALSVDKPRFTLNPTNCTATAIAAGTLSVFDQSASLSTPFQVGGCGALGFKPKLKLRLSGGTKRAQYPALRATLTTRPGDANLARAVVSLPHSEFLAQNHIRTICTRVQFAADACPKASIYGKARAVTPLLDEPLSGPVYLRSSNHSLPDLVADLDGQINVVLDGRIDSARGGIRTTFAMIPDAPVSKFVLEMQGGKKGLLTNSRNLCNSVHRARIELDGQNDKISDSRPVIRNSCKDKHGKHKAKSRNRS